MTVGQFIKEMRFHENMESRVNVYFTKDDTVNLIQMSDKTYVTLPITDEGWYLLDMSYKLVVDDDFCIITLDSYDTTGYTRKKENFIDEHRITPKKLLEDLEKLNNDSLVLIFENKNIKYTPIDPRLYHYSGCNWSRGFFNQYSKDNLNIYVKRVKLIQEY